MSILTAARTIENQDIILDDMIKRAHKLGLSIERIRTQGGLYKSMDLFAYIGDLSLIGQQTYVNYEADWYASFEDVWSLAECIIEKEEIRKKLTKDTTLEYIHNLTKHGDHVNYCMWRRVCAGEI